MENLNKYKQKRIFEKAYKEAIRVLPRLELQTRLHRLMFKEDPTHADIEEIMLVKEVLREVVVN